MCFSPDADFTAAAVVGGVGVVTLRQVRTRRELIVGSLPLLFALHQFSEAFVWLWLRGHVSSGVGHTATCIYVIYAYAALPMIMVRVLNIVGVAVAFSVREAEFTSVWCVYAALASVLILEHLRRQRRLESRPHAVRAAPAAS